MTHTNEYPQTRSERRERSRISKGLVRRDRHNDVKGNQDRRVKSHKTTIEKEDLYGETCN
jgi:hypothetical protein